MKLCRKLMAVSMLAVLSGGCDHSNSSHSWQLAGESEAPSKQIFASALSGSVTPPSSYLWAKALGSATNDFGNAIATDSGGNVYVTGYFTDTTSFGGPNLICSTAYNNTCVFLAKFAADGTPIWSKNFNSAYGSGGNGKALAIDAGGNIFLAGNFSSADFGCGILNGGSVFTVKLAPDGSCLWSKKFRSVATGGVGNSGGGDSINGLAIDSNGDLFMAGRFSCGTNEGCAMDFGGGLIASIQRPSYGGVFLTKISGSNGSYLWSKAYGSADTLEVVAGVAVDASGNAFITGQYDEVLNLGGSNLTYGGGLDIFLAKYRGSDGMPLWSKGFGAIGNDYAMAIAIDSSGAAVITGGFSETVDFGGTSLTTPTHYYSDVFLARFANADGSTLWAKRLGGPSSENGRAIATDANGHIVITGFFIGTADFGTGAPLTAQALDVFLAQYNAVDGSALWAKSFGGANSDVGQGVAIDNSGNTLVTGYFVGPADFGGGLINSNGSTLTTTGYYSDLFIAKYGTQVTKSSTTASLVSSLNPSTSGQPVTFSVSVSPSSATGSVTFFDGGITLGSSNLNGGSASFSSSSLSVGSHTITAVYSGDNNYNSSSSNSVSQTVSSISPTPTPTPTPTPAPATPTPTPTPQPPTPTPLPDTQAPSVSFISPSNGATVSGFITISVSATDNVGVTSVFFGIDGATKCSFIVSPYSCSFDTRTVSDGFHFISATAKDAAGNTTPISIGVYVVNASSSPPPTPLPDTQAPSVSFISPSNGATVSGSVVIQVSASDNVGVASVSLSIDGIAYATVSGSGPYNFTINTLNYSNGSHTLVAKAQDGAGNLSTAQITMSVNNVAPDTQAPVTAITSPVNSYVIPNKMSNLKVYVSAHDNVSLVKVELYVDGALKSSSTAAFTASWSVRKISSGAHTLQSKAYDAAGNIGVSPVITVYK